MLVIDYLGFICKKNKLSIAVVWKQKETIIMVGVVLVLCLSAQILNLKKKSYCLKIL